MIAQFKASVTSISQECKALLQKLIIEKLNVIYAALLHLDEAH